MRAVARYILMGAMGATSLVACKPGDIDEKSVRTQQGPSLLGIAPFSVVESSSNTFLLTLSRAQDADVTLTWTISSIAAPTAGRFSTLTGTATVPKGETTAAVPIPLVNDGIYQGNLDFALTLSGAPSAIHIPVPTITFTLVDDEPPPSVNFASASSAAPEGSGAHAAMVTLSGPSAYATSVHFAVGGTATPGDDFTLSPAASVTFAPGITSQAVTINVIDDYIPEPDETVILTLDGITAGTAVIGLVNPFTHTIVNDDFAPVVLDVTSTAANGAYRAGTIPITIHFTRAVVVTGTPTLTLGTTPNAVATFASGSGTTDLVFNYAIRPGDASVDLEYLSASALSLAGGTMKSTPDALDALLGLPTPGAAHSLSANKTIVIDTTAPTVTNVTSSTPDGPYSTGAVIAVQVAFSEPVSVTGAPRVLLETGATDRYATFTGGSGTTTLSFSYTVQLGDAALDLDAQSANALGLNGGTIVDVAGNAAVLTVPIGNAAGSLAANKNILVDTTRPSVVGVTSSLANGPYPAGTVVPIQIIFSERVYVSGGPTLTLNTLPTNAVVAYASGSGTTTLTFTYTVAAGDNAAPLDEAAASALALNGGAIVDIAANPAVLTLPAPGGTGALGVNKAIVIDTTAPTVELFTATNADGAYPVGSVINVQVVFSEPVQVTGTPQLTLETGVVDRVVNYTSGSGTATLVFAYTVQAGDQSIDLDVTGPTALALNGGAIADPATNAAVLNLPNPGDTGSLSYNKNIVIDTAAPTITGVTSAKPNGAYTTGQVIDVVVNFSEAVTVTGSPQFVLRTNSGATTTINYLGGSGGSALTFRYTVAAGDTTAHLDYDQTTSFRSNGATVRDAAANTAIVTLAAPGAAGSLGASKTLIIDTTAPTVLNVTSGTLNGSYPVNTVIPITVRFSENVFVTGTPTLTLETGATDRAVAYTSGSGTNTLTFRYTVQPGDTSPDLDYVGTAALALAGGTIRDAATNAAVLTLATPGAAGSISANKDIVIDTTAPVVTSLTSLTGDGYYKAGAVINVVVHFSEPVLVSGQPQLTLATGATNEVVAYASGSGTADLTFAYTVQAGDTSLDLDVLNASALTLNGGSITDSATNAATLSLPAPGASGSLGANQNIVVDTTAPSTPASLDDGTWVTSLGQTPPLTWAASTDATSGLDHYEIAIGTTASGVETLGWTPVGLVTSRTQYSLSLTEGQVNYVRVRAVDRAGNVSGVTSGDGFRADVTPPTTPTTIDDGLTSASITQTPPFTWTASTDQLSGLSTYQIAIGSTPGASDVLAWTNVGTVLTTTPSLALTEGNTYFAGVRAVDVAGNIGGVCAGDGWVIGWLAQAYLKPPAAVASNAFGTSVAISGDTMVVGYTGGNGGATVFVRSGATWSFQATLNAGSNAAAGANFGKAVAIDGDTLVVGAPNDNIGSTAIGTAPPGLNLFPANNSGAAYIYTRSGTTWTLQAFAKAGNNAAGMLYGSAVAISGNTVVVGAPAEASNTTGVSTNTSTNTSNTNAGAAYVLTRSGTTWTAQAYLKAATSKSNVRFGASVALNLDTAVVGTPGDDSPSTAIVNGSGGSASTGATGAGAAYVFKRAGTTWTQEAYLKASNAGAGDAFGTAVAVSGNSAVVGAPNEASAQRGVTNGTSAAADNAAANAGAAYVYARASTTWSQSAYLKTANADAGDLFGSAVGLDGTLALVGAPGEASAQTTVGQINAASADNSAAGAGAAYLFRTSGSWAELGYLKAPNAQGGDAFGTSAALSGVSLAVGATGEDSNQTSVTNGQTASGDNSTSNAGAAYVFLR